MDKLHLGIFFDPRHRVIMFSTIFLGLFSALVVAYGSYDYYRLELGDAQDEVKNVSLILEHQVEETLKNIDLVLCDMKERVEAGNGYPHWTKEELNRLAKAKSHQFFPDYFMINFFDSQGRLTGGEGDEVQYVSVKDQEYFQEQIHHSETGLYISKPIVNEASGEVTVVVSRRITKQNGEFAGVVSAEIPAEQFSKGESLLNMDFSEEISVFKLDGHLLLAKFPSKSKELLGKSFAESPLHKIISTSGVSDGLSVQKSESEKSQTIFGYRVMHKYGLLIVASKPTESVWHLWVERAKVVFSFYILCCGVFMFLLYRYLYGEHLLEMQKVQLVQNSKMSVLGEMAGGIAHEINNPLTIIKGRSEQLERMLQREDFEKEKALTLVKGIEKTTLRISNIVKGLKMFSRSGEMDPMTVSYLTDVINSGIELCQEKFKNGNVELKIAETPSVALYCRETQISQVVLNLLSNAFDAVVGADNAWVELSYKEYAKNIEIIVTDSGRGISAEIEEKIMQPFFTTKPVGKGTGLGLSISKGIIEAHDGKLFLNHNCENTQFVISLGKADSIALATEASKKIPNVA